MDTLFIIAKIIVSIIFFAMSIGMVYLCFKAKSIKEQSMDIEKLCREDVRNFYNTTSIVGKVIIELVLSKFSFKF